MNNKLCDKMRILYYGAGWPTNIGNAFIDIGAIAILKGAFPDSIIAFASEMPRWFFHNSAAKFSNTIFHKLCFTHCKRSVEDKKGYIENALDISSITKCDLVVFSGMAMCKEFIHINGPAILRLSQKGTPVLLLGTGASEYSKNERAIYGEFLKRVNPIAFISRDDKSYELFSDVVNHSYKGIDCGFFVKEGYQPFELDFPSYMVAAFDSMPEPQINLKGRQLLRAHHDLWGPLSKEYISTENTLISDIPHDYLTLYANADEVHSDRVHACVAALSYGRYAKLYHPTLRGSLFEAAGATDIRKNIVLLDPQIIDKKKLAQIKLVKQVLDEFGNKLK